MTTAELETIALVVILGMLAGFIVEMRSSSIFGFALLAPVVGVLLLTLCFYLLGRAGAAAALAAGIGAVGKGVRG